MVDEEKQKLLIWRFLSYMIVYLKIISVTVPSLNRVDSRQSRPCCKPLFQDIGKQLILRLLSDGVIF